MHKVILNVQDIISNADVNEWKVDDYRWLIDKVRQVDVAEDAEFQRMFKNFWGYRNFDKGWPALLFETVDSCKNAKPLSFSNVLRALSTKRVEKSTASKVLATIDPSYPLWDAYVARVLGLHEPVGTHEQKLDDAMKSYEELQDWYGSYLASDDCGRVLTEFDELLPAYEDLNPVKKLDYLLWSYGKQLAGKDE